MKRKTRGWLGPPPPLPSVELGARVLPAKSPLPAGVHGAGGGWGELELKGGMGGEGLAHCQHGRWGQGFPTQVLTDRQDVSEAAGCARARPGTRALGGGGIQEMWEYA